MVPAKFPKTPSTTLLTAPAAPAPTGPNTTLSVAPGTPAVPLPPDQLPPLDQLVSAAPVQVTEPARAGTTDSVNPSTARPWTIRPTVRRPQNINGNEEQNNDA